MKFIDQVPRFALKMRILVMTPLMVMPPSSAKLVLVLSFDFSLIGPELSLVEIRESTVFPHTLLEVCHAHKIRLRSSVWALLVGKHPQNQNFTYSSLTLGTLNKMKLMLCVLFTYVMGDKIKRFSCLTYGRIVHKVLIFT